MAIDIRPAHWQRDAAILSEIRRRVFIEEQAVPEALELDAHDAGAWHWLALLDGEPAGTVRMLRDGHIGRLAVLARHRQRGAASALMNAAIAHARAEGLRELYLHAQTHALAFYERREFHVEGPQFMDAGIPHRTMRRLLRDDRVLARDSGRFAVRDRRAVALDLARQCRRQLRLLSNSLDHELYHSSEFADALSRLARTNRYTEIRLLIVDSRPLVQRGHILLGLQRRLSSSIQLRRAACAPEQIRENYLVADDRGIFCYALQEPDKAWADYNNRPVAEDYCTQFDELWNRSGDDPDLRQLNL